MSTITQPPCQRDSGEQWQELWAAAKFLPHLEELLVPLSAAMRDSRQAQMARCITQLLLHNKPPQNQWLKTISICYCPQSVDQVGGSSSLGWIHSCTRGQLAGELWVSFADLARFFQYLGPRLGQPRQLVFVPYDLSSSSRLAHACSHGVLACFQERKVFKTSSSRIGTSQHSVIPVAFCWPRQVTRLIQR